MCWPKIYVGGCSLMSVYMAESDLSRVADVMILWLDGSRWLDVGLNGC